MKKFMKWTGIVLGGLISLVLLAGLALYPSGMEKFTRSYPNIPVEMVNIPTGPDAVAHGRHVSIIWACTKCHSDNLSGMLLANDPFLGAISASNLTSGNGGIGRSYTDADWVRAIRHGVKPDSRVEIFMYDYYSTMSNQDLGALIAYLKQLPPVDSNYPAMHFGPVLTIAPAVGLFIPAAEQIDHVAPRPADRCRVPQKNTADISLQFASSATARNFLANWRIGIRKILTAWYEPVYCQAEDNSARRCLQRSLVR